MALKNDRRKGLIQKVKIGQKQLGISDGSYRDMLEDKYGVRSCTELTVRQLSDLLNHYIRLGWVGPSKTKGRPKNDKGATRYISVPDTDPHALQKRKILAMWKALGWSLDGLKTRLRKQFGVEDILWLHDQAALQTLGRDLAKRCKAKGLQ